MIEVLCHFKGNSIRVVKLFNNEKVYTVKKQTVKIVSESYMFKLYTDNGIVHLQYPKTFNWNLISINETKKKKAVKP